MNEATARARLERMLAITEQPTLTSAEVDDLMLMARRPDAAGLVYGDTDWEPTWDLGGSAAEGWRWKAAKVAGHYDFGADGSSLSKSQVVDHCLRMAEVFGSASRKSGGAGTMTLTGASTPYSEQIGNWNP